MSALNYSVALYRKVGEKSAIVTWFQAYAISAFRNVAIDPKALVVNPAQTGKLYGEIKRHNQLSVMISCHDSFNAHAIDTLPILHDKGHQAGLGLSISLNRVSEKDANHKGQSGVDVCFQTAIVDLEFKHVTVDHYNFLKGVDGTKFYLVVTFTATGQSDMLAPEEQECRDKDWEFHPDSPPPEL